MSYTVIITFRGGFGPEAPDAPPGKSVADLLRAHLSEQEWHIPQMEYVTGCGWHLLCAHGQLQFDLSVSCPGYEEWSVTISPHYTPYFLNRLIGKPASAHVPDVMYLARHVWELVADTGRASDMGIRAERHE